MDRIAAPLVRAGKEKGAGAAFIQGGLCMAGADIVVNLMGRFQFVPAEEDDEATTRVKAARPVKFPVPVTDGGWFGPTPKSIRGDDVVPGRRPLRRGGSP